MELSIQKKYQFQKVTSHCHWVLGLFVFSPPFPIPQLVVGYSLVSMLILNPWASLLNPTSVPASLWHVSVWTALWYCAWKTSSIAAMLRIKLLSLWNVACGIVNDLWTVHNKKPKGRRQWWCDRYLDLLLPRTLELLWNLCLLSVNCFLVVNCGVGLIFDF